MPYLRHVPSGDIYPYNADMALRDDMVEYTPPPEGGKDKPVEAKVEEELVIKPTKVTKQAPKPKDELPNLDDL